MLKLLDIYPRFGYIEYKSKNYYAIMQEITAIIKCLQNMTQLESLHIESDCIIDGKYLSVLQDMKNLRSLHLRGFDFSSGIEHIDGLNELENLHLCHGNTMRTADNAIPPNAFLSFDFLPKLKTIHLENMVDLTNEQTRPLSHLKSADSLTFKHCQNMSGNILQSIGTMTVLKELHIVNCSSDETQLFETNHLVHLRNLEQLKKLSLMFVMVDLYDVLDLAGMNSLETLNIGTPGDITKEEFDIMCLRMLPFLPNLKRVRIYGENEESLDQLIRSVSQDGTGYDDVDLLWVGDWEINFRLFEERHDRVDIS